MLFSSFKMKANKGLESDAVFSTHLLRSRRTTYINLDKI